MASELGVSDAHAFMLTQWLAFARREREIRKEGIRDVFAKAEKGVTKEEYSRNAVKKILEENKALVLAEMETELINMSHNAFLLTRQLMRQAESGGLSVKMNISEIQNIELLKAVAQFEKEIAEKREQRTETILKDPSLIDASISNMSSDFVSEFYRMDLENMTQALRKNTTQSEASLSHLQNELIRKSSEIARFEEFHKNEQKRIADMEKQHFEMQKKLTDIMKQLSLKESELEKKFQSTNTYITMQKILKSKNEQIKKLREGNSTTADDNVAEESD